MIKALMVLVLRNVTFFEVVGVALLIAGLAVLSGTGAALIGGGVAALAKSLELDLGGKE